MANRDKKLRLRCFAVRCITNASRTHTISHDVRNARQTPHFMHYNSDNRLRIQPANEKRTGKRVRVWCQKRERGQSRGGAQSRHQARKSSSSPELTFSFEQRRCTLTLQMWQVYDPSQSSLHQPQLGRFSVGTTCATINGGGVGHRGREGCRGSVCDSHLFYEQPRSLWSSFRCGIRV